MSIKSIDFSREYYRGYQIHLNALTNRMHIEKDGHEVAAVPPEHSWAHARGMIDQLILVDTL